MALPLISKRALQQVIEASHPVANLGILAVRSSVDVYPHMANLLMVMQDTEFTSSFDWQEEFSDQQEQLQATEVVQEADLETLRKIMTAHIRIDRMTDGHLDVLIDNGYWNKCLARMAELHSEMGDD